MIKERMIEAEKVSEVFKGAGNPYRLQVLLLLLERGEMSVGEIKRELETSQSLISQHLFSLRRTRLVKRRRVENRTFYALTERGRAFAQLGKEMLEGRK